MFAIALLLSASTLYAEAIGGYSAGCLKMPWPCPSKAQVIR